MSITHPIRFAVGLVLVAALGAACEKKSDAPAPGATAAGPVAAGEAAKPAPGDPATANKAAETGRAPGEQDNDRRTSAALGTGTDPVVLRHESGEASPGLGAKLAAPAAPAAPPVVKLLEPGAEPRRPLRFHVAAGDRGTLTMTMNMGMTLDMGAAGGGAPVPPMTFPSIAMPMDTEVKEVTADGIRYQFTFREPTVTSGAGTTPGLAGAMSQAFNLIAGISGTALVTDRGVTLSSDFQVPPQAAAQLGQVIDNLEQSISQMSSPFPEEPVGIGARWEVTTTLNQAGMSLDQKAVYTLTALDGDRGTAAYSIEQNAGRQAVAVPGMPPGLEAELLGLESSGTGEMTFDLARLVPVTSNGSIRSNMRMTANMGQSPIEMGMQMTVEMKIEGS